MKNSQYYTKDLSFVIIGKNAEWSIARLLDSILAHMPRQVTSEIIYVDSASIDRTIKVVSRYPVKIVQLSANQPLCASAGRFIGSQHASGKYIAFIDSDMELLDGWSERALKALDGHPEIAVVSGIQANGNPAARPEEHEMIDYPPYQQDKFTEIKFAGSAAIFRHKVLDIVGTWNPYIISDEEPELCLRIRHAGYRIVELSCPSVRHFGYALPTISALLLRRKRRLFLGPGQAIRYHLHAGLILPYLRERGYMISPALAVLLAIGSIFLSCVDRTVFWFLGFLSIASFMFIIDAIRSRSVYRAAFHVLHRALILEGTLKGLFINPLPCDKYPCEVQLLDPYPDVAAEIKTGAS